MWVLCQVLLKKRHAVHIDVMKRILRSKIATPTTEAGGGTAAAAASNEKRKKRAK